MNNIIFSSITAGCFGLVALFVYKLNKIQNVPINKEDEEFGVILEDVGFKNDITRDGAVVKRHFNVEITNNSNRDLLWIRYEVITTFHKSELVFRVTSEQVENTYHCYKHGFTINRKIFKDDSVRDSQAMTFTGENFEECSGVEIYQISGEFDNGDKFQKIINGKVEFNNKDFAAFIYRD